MQLEYLSANYYLLETDAATNLNFPPEIVRVFRMRIQFLRSAEDERDIRAMKSWRYEKLKGKREHERSIRLNDQYRLIFEIVIDDKTRCIRIVGIEDYH